MRTITDQNLTVRQGSEPAPKYRTPPGHRVLHLVIDQATFDLLHIQAIRSRMKFTAYMQRFLQEAFPYGEPGGPPVSKSPEEPDDPSPARTIPRSGPVPGPPCT